MMRTRAGTAVIFPGNWAEMTLEQKRQWRLNNFIKAEGINFNSPEAQMDYQTRAKRIVDVFNVQEPDRVPCSVPVGNLPYILYGINARTAMYDYAQALDACKQFNDKYSAELEYFASPMMTPGRVVDLMDYKLYAWPGHGLPLGAPNVQFMESEYMKVEEYDDLIRDPSDFWFRTYLPRVFGTLEPLRMFQPATNMIEVVSIPQLMPLANPQVQETLLRLVEVGREYQKMLQVIGPYAGMSSASGYPVAFGGFAKAPFDTLGDTLRGTAAIMKDIYRRPDKVLAACDKIADFTINSILKSPLSSGIFLITYPLHKGADGWMSQKQFETFYWPSLKKVMGAFINEGLIQNLFAEGSFNTRLEYFKDFPKGSVGWLFDQTDMARAKQILGDKFCIQGNVPSSLIVTGSAGDVKEYCRKLIQVCGKDGGYMLAAGCTAENPKLENLRAMVQAAKEYGTYR
jgi:uroporphyrinogen-III decarboxylase